MPFTIIQQDITTMHVDAIVNAANTRLAQGGGVCGAIFAAAGAAELQAACRKLAPIQTGQAVITSGFALPSKFVIHTAGPIYRNENAQECAQQLHDSYWHSLQLAAEHHCESIAFPLISSGIYGYPKEEALREATLAIVEFLGSSDMQVYLTFFDKSTLVVNPKRAEELLSYIGKHHYGDVLEACLSSTKDSGAVEEAPSRDEEELEEQPQEPAPFISCTPGLVERSLPLGALSAGLGKLIDSLDEPFNATLLRLIDVKGMSDTEVYKRANIDRKLFAKIRLGKGYMPSKRTIIALAVALRLNLEETNALLHCAGYALSHSQKFDVIIEFFIVNRLYNVFSINEVLFKYDLPLLGT